MGVEGLVDLEFPTDSLSGVRGGLMASGSAVRKLPQEPLAGRHPTGVCVGGVVFTTRGVVGAGAITRKGGDDVDCLRGLGDLALDVGSGRGIADFAAFLLSARAFAFFASSGFSLK